MLVVAFLVSRSCGSSHAEVDYHEAIAIAKREIDYKPDRVGVRILKRGVRSQPFWAVSLSSLDASGRITRSTLVVVDATTGRVDEVRAVAR
ncbi:MAG: hypothetical protein M3312_01885 [Actinomycetota bacterium]|nr:hypothetical protein [Actinomycetota bacterium]